MKSGYNNKDAMGRWGIAGLYLLLCVLYFLPIEAPYKLVYPLLLLTITSLPDRSPLFTLALAFSAVGDFCGAEGRLLVQIGAFAVAQICYLLLLARRNAGSSPRRITFAALIPVVLTLLAFVGIIPAIEKVEIKIGATIYALLIGAMATTAGLSKSWSVRVGGVLFMLSDFMLAHILFVAYDSTLLAVSLGFYFAGQLLLWLGLRASQS